MWFALDVSRSAASPAELWPGRSLITALSVSKLTAASSTPGLLSRMRFTDALQPPHFMLLTSRSTVSVSPAYQEDNV